MSVIINNHPKYRRGSMRGGNRYTAPLLDDAKKSEKLLRFSNYAKI